ncbi:MAG: hypothetical protein U9R72_05635 [Chloroflexota bacterium]|nr:hypothetical protein [Chloroflexota bacterium]
MNPELVGVIVGTALTLFILSYLVGDNPLYRLGLHLFIGTLVGYSFGTVLREVVVRTALPGLISRPASVGPAVLLGVLLLFKGFPRQAYVGNLSMAYLIGVGAAVAVGGTLAGMLAFQVAATGRALAPASVGNLRFGLADGVMIVVGTVSTLLSFTFVRPKAQGGQEWWGRLLGGVTWVGRLFLVSALGIAFAGALTASLSILIGRMQYLIDAFCGLAGW